MFLQTVFAVLLLQTKLIFALSNEANLILSLVTNKSSLITYFSCSQTKRGSVSLLKTLSLETNIASILLNQFTGNFYNHMRQEERTFNVVDLSCNFTQLLIDDADGNNLFQSPHKWLFICNDIGALNIHPSKLFKNANILIDSDVTIALSTNTSQHDLIKIFKRNTHLETIIEPFGILNNDHYDGKMQLVDDFEVITAERRRNLHQIVLNNCNVITHNSSFHHLTDKRAKHIDTITKVNYIFMEHLGDMLNVSMNYSFVATWGYLGNDSKWTGMIGELTTQRADIGGTPLFFTSDRVRIIDYIGMTTPTKSKFVFRQPKLSYITNVFTLPFHRGVWLASFALVVVTAAGLLVGIKWEWYKKRKYSKIYAGANNSNATELHDSIVDVAFMAMAAVCQQGASAIPFNIPGRIITIMLYTSLMFLYTSYSANIVALLQSSSTSIQTLEDLLKSRLQIGVDDTVFNHFYFPNASEPIRRALYLQKVAPPGQKQRYFPIEEGVRRLRQGLFAFHMETGAGYKIVGETFMEDEKCGLQEIQFLQVPDPFLAVQKNTSFKEMIKIGLRKLHESGIQNREVSLLYTKKPICISRGSSFVGVAIVDCYPAAMVYAIGMAIAFAVFLLEVFTHQFMKRHRFDQRRLNHRFK